MIMTHNSIHIRVDRWGVRNYEKLEHKEALMKSFERKSHVAKMVAESR